MQQVAGQEWPVPKIAYTPKKFTAAHREIIDNSNIIIGEYNAQGYKLTLRQLYYQHVARGWLPNTQQSYSRLGDIVSSARRAGLIDWDAIEDRTRNLEAPTTWDNPAEIVAAVSRQYKIDVWADQPYYIECFVEKEALVGVIEVACEPIRVPYFACRGYTSDSELWAAGQRMKRVTDGGRMPLILHLGDHDPSGIDMTRDIIERVMLFARTPIEVRRLALNMDQVHEYGPPPNPAKVTDSRFESYEAAYGDESWELDALPPEVLTALIRDEVSTLIDQAAWDESIEREESERSQLRAVSNHWDEVAEFASEL